MEFSARWRACVYGSQGHGCKQRSAITQAMTAVKGEQREASLLPALYFLSFWGLDPPLPYLTPLQSHLFTSALLQHIKYFLQALVLGGNTAHHCSADAG